MKNILIIGFGNLGKRYYESISQLPNIIIHIYDPNIKLDTTNNLIDTLKVNFIDNLKVNFIDNLKVNFIIDLAIVSTCADVRYNVSYELITNNTVKNIVFEKFLFLKDNDYIAINELLIQKNINAWVNCTRRLYEHYKYIKQKLDEDKNKKLDEDVLKMTVIGEDWQLCSNSVHFIDIYEYLTDKKIDDLQIKDVEIIDSKRNGYKEMHGHIYNDEINIICTPKTNNNIIAKKIYNSKYDFVILNHDNMCHMVEYNKKKHKFNTKTFHVPYLSEIAKNFVQDILDHKPIDLPKFNESIEYHKKLLILFKTEFDKQNLIVKFT